MDIKDIALIATSLLGGGGWLRFVFERKKNYAEAEQIETDIGRVINSEWQKLFEQYKQHTHEEIDKLRKRVEHLENELERERERVKQLEDGHNN